MIYEVVSKARTGKTQTATDLFLKDKENTLLVVDNMRTVNGVKVRIRKEHPRITPKELAEIRNILPAKGYEYRGKMYKTIILDINPSEHIDLIAALIVIGTRVIVFSENCESWLPSQIKKTYKSVNFFRNEFGLPKLNNGEYVWELELNKFYNEWCMG